jgi:hypothetical protein
MPVSQQALLDMLTRTQRQPTASDGTASQEDVLSSLRGLMPGFCPPPAAPFSVLHGGGGVGGGSAPCTARSGVLQDGADVGGVLGVGGGGGDGGEVSATASTVPLEAGTSLSGMPRRFGPSAPADIRMAGGSLPTSGVPTRAPPATCGDLSSMLKSLRAAPTAKASVSGGVAISAAPTPVAPTTPQGLLAMLNTLGSSTSATTSVFGGMETSAAPTAAPPMGSHVLLAMLRSSAPPATAQISVPGALETSGAPTAAPPSTSHGSQLMLSGLNPPALLHASLPRGLGTPVPSAVAPLTRTPGVLGVLTASEAAVTASFACGAPPLSAQVDTPATLAPSLISALSPHDSAPTLPANTCKCGPSCPPRRDTTQQGEVCPRKGPTALHAAYMAAAMQDSLRDGALGGYTREPAVRMEDRGLCCASASKSQPPDRVGTVGIDPCHEGHLLDPSPLAATEGVTLGAAVPPLDLPAQGS